ncbi:MAG: disulfide bond formation protein B [Xanthobacteraceae bacterium]|nr:disulfide bond formation protein B [Xanthobacteraceae bacterium]
MSALAKTLIGRARAAPLTAACFAIAAAAAATLAAAWFFQLVLGYAPCELCLYQRMPYYFIVPFALILGFLARHWRYSNMARAGLLVMALLLAFNAGLGVYHAGIEWDWWQGPVSCSGGGSSAPSGDILSALKRSSVVPCNEAPWRFLGLSFAGYNTLIAGALALVAIAAARLPAYGSSSVSQ